MKAKKTKRKSSSPTKKELQLYIEQLVKKLNELSVENANLRNDRRRLGYEQGEIYYD